MHLNIGNDNLVLLEVCGLGFDPHSIAAILVYHPCHRTWYLEHGRHDLHAGSISLCISVILSNKSKINGNGKEKTQCWKKSTVWQQSRKELRVEKKSNVWQQYRKELNVEKSPMNGSGMERI